MSKTISKLQQKTRTRNFSVMVLRGICGQLKRLELHHPELTRQIFIIRSAIDNCLRLLNARTQEEHIKREKL